MKEEIEGLVKMRLDKKEKIWKKEREELKEGVFRTRDRQVEIKGRKKRSRKREGNGKEAKRE